MNEKIIKPMSVARQEFIDHLIDDINNCELPLFIIEPILQDILTSVKAAAQQQYQEDKMQYEQLLRTAKSDKHE